MDNLLSDNLKTLGFGEFRLCPFTIREAVHFLFTKLDAEEAEQRFAKCWPVTDGRTASQFRKTVASWLGELKEQEDAAPFLVTFHPRMLHHIKRRESIEFLGAFSVLVLQRCVDRMSGVERVFSYTPHSGKPLMPALMEYATQKHLSSVAKLKDSRSRSDQEYASLSAYMTEREAEFNLQLKMPREQPPTERDDYVKQESEKISAEAEGVQSFLEMWTKSIEDIFRELGEMKTVSVGPEHDPEGKLNFVGPLCRLAGELKITDSKLQNADVTEVEDATPFLQLNLDAKNERKAKLRVAAKKLERMLACFDAFISHEQEGHGRRPVASLLNIEATAFNLNRRPANPPAGQASADTAEVQDTIDADTLRGAIGGPASDVLNESPTTFQDKQEKSEAPHKHD